jgi:hypothetical protein
MAYRFQKEVETGVISSPELLGPVSGIAAQKNNNGDSEPSTSAPSCYDGSALETKPFALSGGNPYQILEGSAA